MADEDRAPRPTPARAQGGNLPDVAEVNAITQGRLPGLLEFEVTALAEGRLEARMPVRPHHLAPNGYLHAATVVALADTACGVGCRLALPEGASGFTTVELKVSYLSTARDGAIMTTAELVHGGRRTQVWDATVLSEEGRRIALFRCTQLVLWPDP